MKTILLHNMTPEELKDVIISEIKIEAILLKAKEKENYSVQEVSKLLGCAELTIYNYIKKGLLPASKIGRNYIIKKLDIENTLKKVKSLKYKRRTY
ncbi:helix-turn-helix domain-containing protein [Flavivirga spongiicola]|uniref:Helix-turn-helix domain-containing protein n=1 Tax=Flavivirga spongiicola TaxID=421621 RepID=A0ABU7XU07_9FLAO|nr:helix-turn-helix domain-containing protein [Flavivirga sp. MEBiC05379]MDO5978992.1 helix-turn-helix domain-containing protein [Flavivirga sp. MEBiC05379]